MKHDIIEKNIGLMIILIVVAISFGGLVEVVPLFWDKNTNEPIEGLKPVTAIQLEGRDIYIREGCHSELKLNAMVPIRVQANPFMNIPSYGVLSELALI
jgi:cbb3-type cytochrome c oxidase subunit II